MNRTIEDANLPTCCSGFVNQQRRRSSGKDHFCPWDTLRFPGTQGTLGRLSDPEGNLQVFQGVSGSPRDTRACSSGVPALSPVVPPQSLTGPLGVPPQSHSYPHLSRECLMHIPVPVLQYPMGVKFNMGIHFALDHPWNVH